MNEIISHSTNHQTHVHFKGSSSLATLAFPYAEARPRASESPSIWCSSLSQWIMSGHNWQGRGHIYMVNCQWIPLLVVNNCAWVYSIRWAWNVAMLQSICVNNFCVLALCDFHTCWTFDRFDDPTSLPPGFKFPSRGNREPNRIPAQNERTDVC